MEAHEFISSDSVVNDYAYPEEYGVYYLKGIVRVANGEALRYIVGVFDGCFSEIYMRRQNIRELMLDKEEYEAFIREHGLCVLDYEYNGYRILYHGIPSYKVVDGNIVLAMAGEYRLIGMTGMEALCLDFRGKPYSFAYHGMRHSIHSLKIGSFQRTRRIPLKDGTKYMSAYLAERYLRSEEYRIEQNRDRFTGADAGVYRYRDYISLGGLALTGLFSSPSGVCNVSKAVTEVRLSDDEIFESGVKVLSLEKCEYLYDCLISADSRASGIDKFCLILPSKTIMYGRGFVEVKMFCREFRLKGKIAGIRLSVYGADIKELDRYSLSSAEDVTLTNCTGVKEIVTEPVNLLNYFNHLELHNTDTEYLSANMVGSWFRVPIILDCCKRLKTVKLELGLLALDSMQEAIKGCDEIEEISLLADCIHLRFSFRQSNCIDFSVYPKLTRLSIMISKKYGMDSVEMHGSRQKAGKESYQA